MYGIVSTKETANANGEKNEKPNKNCSNLDNLTQLKIGHIENINEKMPQKAY